MSRRDWGFILAIGLGAFCGPGLAQSPDCQGATCKPPTETSDGGGHAGQSAEVKERFVLPVQIIEDPDGAQRATESERKAEEHDAADLEAQRKAADAAATSAEVAEWQKIPTIAQLVLAGMAAVGLFVSLYYTRQSIILNRAATDAAVEGNATTIKAIDQEQINARHQLRAYITASWASAEYDGRFSQVVMGFQNFGATPALWINIHAECIVVDTGDQIIDLPINRVEAGVYWQALGGGEETSLQVMYGDLIVDAMIEVQNASGKKKLLVFGRVRYETIFHEVYETDFAFHASFLKHQLDEQDKRRMFKMNQKLRSFHLLGEHPGA